MAVESIGVDVVEVARMEADIERYGDRFLQRILSDAEQSVLAERVDKAVFLAGRFAGKEAVIKALGRFLSDRPPYAEIEITNDPSGQPVVVLSDVVRDMLGGASILISISHEKSYAVAMVVISSHS
ncbi:holo-[acyl-carrier-protein] synthase [candidate division GN15 bacterium]|nr:holo-[acyl-carrier-protein] synthase [candidate division GN15 bacterium]